jgi:hypothetical protein
MGGVTAGNTDETERELHTGGEESLWRAVITRTIEEWQSGPLRRRLEAGKYLFSDMKDFPRVCASAGIDAVRLRSKLVKLRDSLRLDVPGSRVLRPVCS